MKLNSTTISFRIIFLISILLSFEATIVYFGITRAQDLLNRLDSVAKVQLPSTIDMLAVKTNIDNTRATVIEAILSNQANAKDKIPSLVKKTKELAVEMESSLLELSKLNLDADMKAKIVNFASDTKAYGDFGVKLAEAVQKENWDAILDLNPKFEEAFNKILEQFVYFDSYIRSSAENLSKQGSDIIRLLASLSTIAFVISIVVSVFVFRSLKQSLISVLQTTSSSMENNFKIVDDLSSRTNELNQTTQSQLEAIQNSVQILSEITEAISQTSQNAQESLQSAESVKEKAIEGQGVMGKMKDAVEEIQAATAHFEEVLNTIKSIGARTSTIKEIVERTQMLSFNATLEEPVPKFII